MIRRFYVHNFRCLENFELPISGQSSVLLIGKNGSGKTTVGLALEILQKIARGTNRVGDLVKIKDFARGSTDPPMRIELEVELEAKTYKYSLTFALLDRMKDVMVLEEGLEAESSPVYTRQGAQLTLESRRVGSLMAPPSFPIDHRLVALPIIQEQLTNDPVFVFREWLARMLILRPVPSLIGGDSEQETLEPNAELTNYAAWFSGVLSAAPAAYAEIDKYLKQVMPDLKDVQNPRTGKESKSLVIQFSSAQRSLSVPFEDLSDGEKCFMICALVLAANHAYGPLFCYWDEPDNYLALSEVGQFVLALRKAFQSGGQFIATSHNPEVIRSFSDDNTLLLYRNSHLEPTLVRPLKDLNVSGDLVGALIRDDVVP